MIKLINNLDRYISFIDSFDGDPVFSDPHLNRMKAAEEDIPAWILRPHHYCFVVETNNKTTGLFVLIIYPDEKYVEMILGISRDADAVEEMLSYLEDNYPGYHTDFVFNPKWFLLKTGLEKRGAHFDIEQQRMTYTHKLFDINTDGVVLFDERYKDQYIEMHDKDLYWVAEKVIQAKNRFKIYFCDL